MGADNTIEIRIVGKNEAGDTIAEANGQLTSFKREGDNASGSAVNLQAKLNLLSQGFDMATGVIMDTVNAAVDLSNSVQDTAMMLGVTNQEASTLIQVADDARVSVGELTMAFRTAAKDGITPNIATLIQLGEEYKAIQDPAARLQFAMDKFGRSGIAMSRILALDSKELAAMAAEAQAAGTILDDQFVAGAEDARMAMDTMGDATTGLKLAFFELVGPGFSAFVDGAASLVRATTHVTSEFTNTMQQIQASGLSLGELYDETWAVIYTDRTWADVLTEVNQSEANRNYMLPQVAASTTALASATDIATTAIAGYTGAAFAAADAQYNWNTSMGASAPVMTSLQSAISGIYSGYSEIDEMARLASEGLGILSDSMAEQQRIALVLEIATGDLSAAEIEARLNSLDSISAMESLNAALEAGTIDKYQWIGALSDGIVTQEEVNGLLGETEDALGTIPPVAEGAAASMATSGDAMAESLGPAALEADSIVEAFDNLDGREITATINLDTVGSGGGGGGPNEFAANGADFTVPSGYQNDSYTVGVSSGEHVTVTPAGEQPAASKVYNITINDTAAAKMFLEQQRIEETAEFSALMG